MFLLIDILIAGYGVYALYAYYLMVSKGEVKENILLSKTVSFRKCKDQEGYKRYMAPKLLIFGICTFLCGALGFANDYAGVLGNLYLVIMLLFCVILGWFVVVTKKAVKRFW